MKRLWLLFSQTVTVLLAAYFVVSVMKPQWLGSRPGTDNAVAVLQAPAAGPRATASGSYSPAAKRASPAVVSISTSKAIQRRPHGTDPWFRFFFGEQGNQPQAGLGSGVIVSSSGYILTNNHVVEDADDIEVVLNDSRRAKARIIGQRRHRLHTPKAKAPKARGAQVRARSAATAELGPKVSIGGMSALWALKCRRVLGTSAREVRPQM